MNKNTIRIAITLALVLAGSIALGAAEPIYELVSTLRPTWFQSGIYIGPASQNPVRNTTNKITSSLTGSIAVDFDSDAGTCVDSSAITVTGAKLGDPCIVGSSIAWEANQEFSCYVSAADAVKVRFCPAGTAADPASATYNVRLLSNQ